MKDNHFLDIVQEVRSKYPEDIIPPPKGTSPDSYTAAGVRLACDSIRKKIEKIREVNFRHLQNRKNGKFVVRLYDGFDNEWIDVSGDVPFNIAKRIWNEKTKQGTKNLCYDDIDYYDIFPADTKMLRSSGIRWK